MEQTGAGAQGEVERERRLRALHLERRRAQEELEATVHELDAAAATLACALRELGERGVRCAVEVGPHRLTGVVTHVGDDVVRVAGDSGTGWDVALARVSAVLADGAGRGVWRVGQGHPVTLLARARELQGTGEVVEVGRMDRSDPVRGRLDAVSKTHLDLDRGPAGRALVAWPAVAWMSPA